MNGRRSTAQVLVFFAFALVPLLAVVGLVVDGGTLYLQRRSAQNAADAAAMAGTYALTNAVRGTAENTVATRLCQYALANRFGPAPLSLVATFVKDDLTDVGTIAHTSDCSGIQPTSVVDASATGVKVVLTIGPYNTYLLGIVGLNSLSANARGVASLTGSAVSSDFLAFDPSQCGALSVTGGSKLLVTNGDIQVNSTCSTGTGALYVDGGGIVSATNGTVGVTGTASVSGGGSVTPAAIHPPPQADPFLNLPVPNVTGLTLKTAANCTGASLTISPGIYPSVLVSNGCALTVNPGNYIIGSSTGNLQINFGSVAIGSASANTTFVLTHGMSISNGPLLSGTNVLFYNGCLTYPTPCRTTDTFGPIAFSGGANMLNVKPQTSGTYKNMTFFQDPKNPQPMQISNGATLGTGTIYGPAMPVTIIGGSITGAQFLADSFVIRNGAVVSSSVPNSQKASLTKVGMAQ